MTVGELIERLERFDRNLRVVTPGFDECGFEDIEDISLIEIIFHDEAEKLHRGRHEESEDGVISLKIDWQ